MKDGAGESVIGLYGLKRDRGKIVYKSHPGKEDQMARYGKKSQKMVKEAMEKLKEGKLKSGKSGKKVTSRKQAIAIGLSEARKKGAKVPRRSK